MSRVGVVADGLVGEDGLDGRFLSADIALFGVDKAEVDDVRLAIGDGLRFGTVVADGVDDLYLELTSLVRNRWLVPFLFSAGSNGGLGLVVSNLECFSNTLSDSHTSIQIVKIRPH